MWALFWWDSGPFKSPPFMGEASLTIGLALLVGAGPLLAIVINSQIVKTELLPNYPGAHGVLSLLRIFISVYGGVLIGTSLRGKAKRDDSANQGHSTFDFRRAFGPAILAVLGIIMVLVIIVNPSTIARIDAENTLLNAPHANIELKATQPGSLHPLYDECRTNSSGCNFRVVLVDSRFVYVRLVEPDTSGNEQQSRSVKRILAFPADDIATITYISE